MMEKGLSLQVTEERTYQPRSSLRLPMVPLPEKDEVPKTLEEALLSPQEKESQGRAQLVRAQFWKTELCRFYPKCRKGDLCPFAHTDIEVKERPNLTKTSLCVAWTKGCCPLSASECKFAHGTSQLRKTGLFSESQGPGKKGQTPKGTAAKSKKQQQQQRFAHEKESEFEPGTPSDTSGGTPVSLPSTPTEFPQFAVMQVQAPIMQPSIMQVAMVLVPVSMPMQGPIYNQDMLDWTGQQAMTWYYED
jgi:hypothetical protein